MVYDDGSGVTPPHCLTWAVNCLTRTVPIVALWLGFLA